VEGLVSTSPVEALWQRRKIRMRSSRLSTHIYNSEAEIDATLEIVRDLAQ
jgi:selenocysteine lyase/cysteine desulfurase